MTETRDNFIRTLKETADIAEACGEKASASVIYTLLGVLITDDVENLCHYLAPFNQARLAMLARKE